MAVISRPTLLGVYQLFIYCQRHLIFSRRTQCTEYCHEYDWYAFAGYDTFACHLLGVFAANQTWPVNNPQNPMLAPFLQFPTLVLPPPFPAALAIWSERSLPQTNVNPPVFFLPTTIAFCTTQFPDLAIPHNFVLPPVDWTPLARRTNPIANIPSSWTRYKYSLNSYL